MQSRRSASSPRRHVRLEALRALLPEGLVVTFVPDGEAAPSAAVAVESPIPAPKPGRYFLQPPAMSTDPSKLSLVSPYWVVRGVEDEALANMELQEATVSVKTSPKAVATVTLMVLRNNKALVPGEELVQHRPKKRKRASA